MKTLATAILGITIITCGLSTLGFSQNPGAPEAPAATTQPQVKPDLAEIIHIEKLNGLADESLPAKPKFQASLKAWTETKGKNAGSYSYRVDLVSLMHTTEYTIITVKENKVVERRLCSEKRIDGDDKKPETQVIYVERGPELGSHENGAPVMTIDDHYASASANLDNKVCEVLYDRRGRLAGHVIRENSCPSYWMISYIDEAAE